MSLGHFETACICLAHEKGKMREDVPYHRLMEFNTTCKRFMRELNFIGVESQWWEAENCVNSTCFTTTQVGKIKREIAATTQREPPHHATWAAVRSDDPHSGRQERKTWTWRWDEQLILMTWEETKKKPERNDGDNKIGIQKREQSLYVLLFCVVGCSCIMWCSLTLSTCTSRTPRLFPETLSCTHPVHRL